MKLPGDEVLKRESSIDEVAVEIFTTHRDGQSASGAASLANQYQVQNEWPSAPWHPGGVWVLGCRCDQGVVAIDITSSDDGQTLVGTMTYENEGPIGFRATLISPRIRYKYWSIPRPSNDFFE